MSIEQEPDDLTIAYMSGFHDGKKKREWVGLTDEEIEEIWGEDLRVMYSGNIEATKSIEAKLKEKNT